MDVSTALHLPFNLKCHQYRLALNTSSRHHLEKQVCRTRVRSNMFIPKQQQQGHSHRFCTLAFMPKISPVQEMRSHSDSVLMRSVQYSLQFHHMIIPITHTTVAYRYHHHRSATDKIFLPTNQPSPPPPPYQLLDRSLTCNHSIISGGSDPL